VDSRLTNRITILLIANGSLPNVLWGLNALKTAAVVG